MSACSGFMAAFTIVMLAMYVFLIRQLAGKKIPYRLIGVSRTAAIQLNAGFAQRRLRPGADIERVKSELRRTVGEKYQVLDRMEQQADVFNVMKVEKFFAYLFLTFIILLATFNVVSSLSMVILEKRDDVRTFRHLGMSTSRVRSIFVTEGSFIALIGTLSGVGLGVLLVLLQQQFGLIRMGDGSNFITPTYPVSLRLSDTLIIFGTSLGVGCLSVWYTVRTLSSRFL